MPLLTLHLCRLNIFTSVAVFLQELQAEADVKVVLASRPRNTIIKATNLDAVGLSKRYELLLLLQTPSGAIPSHLRGHVWYEYKMSIGIPSRMLETYPEHNAKLLQDASGTQLTGALEKQGKEILDPDLLKFMETLTKNYGDKPVTMLNLLRFDGQGGKESYMKYGEAYGPISKRHGGSAKLVSSVVASLSNGAAGPGEEPSGSKEGEWWDQISLVHYPSIKAFCDMLASEDYQEINKKFRTGSLKDTMLVCTTEFALGSDQRKTKL